MAGAKLAAVVLDKAADEYNKTQGITKIIATLLESTGDNATSLTKVVQKTMVNSMVYVEEAMVNEEITPALMGTLNQIYISYILTALNIYTSVDKYAIIEQIMGRIATEDLEIDLQIDPLDLISEGFGTDVSTEAAGGKHTIDDTVKHLVSGKLIEFDFAVGVDADKKKVTVTIPIYVQLRPVFMPASVADAIITLNFGKSLLRRWKMVKAGEISLFKDFIGARDLNEKHAKALSEDKSNVLSNFYREKGKKQRKRLNSAIYDKKNNNLASSMLIFTKDTFDEACNNAEIDFESPRSRQRFFDEAYAMIVVVVDQMYDICDIYYNGISSVSQVPFSAIKSAGGKSGTDLTELMNMIAKGSAPKF